MVFGFHVNVQCHKLYLDRGTDRGVRGMLLLSLSMHRRPISQRPRRGQIRGKSSGVAQAESAVLSRIGSLEDLPCLLIALCTNPCLLLGGVCFFVFEEGQPTENLAIRTSASRSWFEFPVKYVQACGIKGFIPTSLIQGHLPPLYGGG